MRNKNIDTIIYQQNNQVSFKKDDVITGNQLSQHYNRSHKIEEVQTLVVNPSKELTKIKDKLTKLEWFILENYVRS